MELWDLYDKNRRLLDKKIFRGEPIPEGCYYLAIHVCIFNNKNEMLIQKRTKTKAVFGGYWDLTAGGGAQSGDSSQTAIERELREELGIDMSFADKRPALTIHFDRGFDDIYLVREELDTPSLTLQEDEVEDVAWVSHERLLEMIDRGEFVPYHKPLISLLFDMLTYRDAIRR